MSRPLRIEFPGALYHVMARGNERREIVRDVRDRVRWLEMLRDVVETYKWKIHALVLMTNHFHVFIETPCANLGSGMGYFNSRYAAYFNRRHKRVGHLFQGRYKAQIIETEGYYLEISRYIHLNPVRAAIVSRPEQWPWSSYPGYIDPRQRLPWIRYDRVLGEFGENGKGGEACMRYQQFVLDGVVRPDEVMAERMSTVVGNARFVDEMRARVGRRNQDLALPEARDLIRRPSLSQIASAVSAVLGADPQTWQTSRRAGNLSRVVAAYLARRCFGYSSVEVAGALGYRSHASVAYAVRRVDAADRTLISSVKQIQETLGLPTVY